MSTIPPLPAPPSKVDAIFAYLCQHAPAWTWEVDRNLDCAITTHRGLVVCVTPYGSICIQSVGVFVYPYVYGAQSIAALMADRPAAERTFDAALSAARDALSAALDGGG